MGWERAVGTRPRQVHLPIGEAGPKLQPRKNSERSKGNQKIRNILEIYAAVLAQRFRVTQKGLS